MVAFPVPRAAAASAVTATTTDYLNLREGAGTNTKVLLTLGKNVSVTILDSSDPQWAKVQTADGKTGYCSKQYLSISSAGSPPPASGSSSGSTATTTDNLNLRQSASSSANILQVLSKGTALTVLDASNANWVKVQTAGGAQGWCSRQYLSLSGGTQTGAGGTGSSQPAAATTTDNLNLRQSASPSAGVLQVLPKGTALTVLDASDSAWVKVQTAGGTQGWCSRQYLSLSGGTQTGAGTGGSQAATAKTTDYLNLREGAGTNYKVLLTLGKDVTVAVLDNSNAQWVKVRTQNGTQGWCSRQYLTVSAPTGGGTSSAPAGSSSAPSSPPSSSVSSNPAAGVGEGDSGGGSESGTPGITGATVTADVLRLREQANTDSKVLANLTNGTVLQVLSAPASGWVRVRTADGKTGYVSTDYVRIQYSDGTTEGGGSGTTASSLTLSSGTQSVPVGKTLYLRAATNPSGADVGWTTSNPAVATVMNGFVTAVSKGTATITAKSGSATAACSVTVTDAEPVRTAFASPNVASPGAAVTLTAVTDLSRDGVRFLVSQPDGGTVTVNADACEQQTSNGVTTKKWTGKTSFPTAGSYTVVAQSSAGGAFSSTGFTTSAFVATQSDRSATTAEERRASDEMISLISQWEGYRAAVYTDTMSSAQVPTIGYGCTLGENAVFYNNIGETEAWSMMVNRINASSYTSELNKMIRNDGFLMNQYQADCLISFAYNVGSGYFNSSNEADFIKIMKNAVQPPDFSSSTTYEATVTKDTVVRSNSGSLSGEIGTVAAGASVLVTGGDFADPEDGWYRVQFPDGTSGWINSGYVSLGISASLVHDLKYTNAYAFGTELIRWNQAGGKFYTGLFYRRLGEANVYNYGDYGAARYNKYNYGYPSAAASLS